MNALPSPPEQLSLWIIFSLLIGGVVILAALAAHDAQRAANRAVRWVWCVAIIAIGGLSLAAPLRRAEPSRSPLPYLVVDHVSNELPRESAGGAGYWLTRTRDAALQPVNVVLQASQSVLSRVPAPMHRLIGWAWLFASLGTLSVFAWSYWRIRRQMQQWPTQQFGATTARIAPTAGPAVVGLAPSEIILPTWLLRCPEEEQQLVITHESEHVRAGDPWLLVAACAAVALMPWHPAMWFALGRLRLAIELDCDRRVLRRGVPAAAYGSLLIDLSAVRPSLPSAMPAFSCNGSYLERRLVAMTARPSRFSSSRRAAGALVALAALVTACESKLPTSAEIENLDAAKAVAQPTVLAMTEEGKTAFVIDGKKATELEARAVEASRIASLMVARKTGSDDTEIRILTKDASARGVKDSVTGDFTAIDFVESGNPAATIKLRADSISLVRKQGIEMRALQRDGSAGVIRGRSAGDTVTGRIMLRSDTPSSFNRNDRFGGLLFVDGVLLSSSDVNSLDIAKENIESVEVIKGAAAKAKYSDPRAANGVILVTTKKKR